MKYSVILVFLVSITLLFSCVVSEKPSSSYNPPDNTGTEPEPEPEPEPDPFDIRPSKPENIREVEITHEMITIAWDGVYNAMAYYVYYGCYTLYPVTSFPYWEWEWEENYQLISDVNITSFTLSNLQSNHSYAFSVTSWNNGGESSIERWDIESTTVELWVNLYCAPLWPPIPDHNYYSYLYVDGSYVDFCDWERSYTWTHSVLTGYRYLQLIETQTGREVGKYIYITSDGYNWDHRNGDYDYKNY